MIKCPNVQNSSNAILAERNLVEPRFQLGGANRAVRETAQVSCDDRPLNLSKDVKSRVVFA